MDRGATVRFACDGCGKTIRCDERLAGHKRVCPNCQAPVVVPQPDAPTPDELPTLTELSEPENGPADLLGDDLDALIPGAESRLPSALETPVPALGNKHVERAVRRSNKAAEERAEERRRTVILRLIVVGACMLCVVCVSLLLAIKPIKNMIRKRTDAQFEEYIAELGGSIDIKRASEYIPKRKMFESPNPLRRAFGSRECTIDLSGTDITDEDLQRILAFFVRESNRLPRWEATELLCADTQITDKGIVDIAELPHVHTFDFSDTKVTAGGLKRFVEIRRASDLGGMVLGLPPMAFKPQEWKAAGTDERGAMLADLLDVESLQAGEDRSLIPDGSPLIGKSADELKEMLGDPDDVFVGYSCEYSLVRKTEEGVVTALKIHYEDELAKKFSLQLRE